VTFYLRLTGVDIFHSNPQEDFRNFILFLPMAFLSQKVVVCLAIPQINKKICHICQLKMHTVKFKKNEMQRRRKKKPLPVTILSRQFGNLFIFYSVTKIVEGISLLFTTFFSTYCDARCAFNDGSSKLKIHRQIKSKRK